MYSKKTSQIISDEIKFCPKIVEIEFGTMLNGVNSIKIIKKII